MGAEWNRLADNLLCVVDVVLNSLIDAANYRGLVVDLAAAAVGFEDLVVAAYSEGQVDRVVVAIAEIAREVGRYFCPADQCDLSSQPDCRFDFVVEEAPNGKVDIVDSRDFA